MLNFDPHRWIAERRRMQSVASFATVARVRPETVNSLPREDAPVTFDLPTLSDSTIAPDAARAILEAVAEGRITPSEAETVFKLVEGWRQSQGRLESQQENQAIWGDLLPSLG